MNLNCQTKNRANRRGLKLILPASAVYYCVEEKAVSIEARYREYLENANQELLDFKLLEYKDASTLFEQKALGNKANSIV